MIVVESQQCLLQFDRIGAAFLLPIAIVTTRRVSGQVSGTPKTLGNRLQDLS